MNKKELESFLLNNRDESFIICSHISPDFDALSSSMMINLMSIYRSEIIIDENDINKEDLLYFEKTYNNFVGCGTYRFEYKTKLEQSKLTKKTLVMVDICDFEKRLPKEIVKNLSKFKKIVVIDHHEEDEQIKNKLRDINPNIDFYISPSSTSCSELIYETFNSIKWPYLYKHVPLSSNKLYTFGILGDTSNQMIGTAKYQLDDDISYQLNKDWFSLTSRESMALVKLMSQITTNGYAYISLNEKNQYPNPDKLIKYINYGLDKMAFDVIQELPNGTYRHSLRAGANIDFNVLPYANAVGGGGHEKRAGARTQTKEPLIINN